jgi:hypothetical protein
LRVDLKVTEALSEGKVPNEKVIVNEETDVIEGSGQCDAVGSEVVLANKAKERIVGELLF